jgi:arylsulfatase A-like enzyme
MKKSLYPTFVFLCLFLWSCTATKEEVTDSPPNIILIMTDDHAKQAISAYGSQLIQTPNLDRIASEGIKFNNSFVTNSICAPSRAVILSGKYSHMNGLMDNTDVFDSSQLTFPKLLQKAGYFTSVVGKWHLKSAPAGFDFWSILIGQGAYYNPTLVEMGDTSDVVGYTTDVVTDKALATLENRDTTKPFCMLYYHKAPHRNWMPNTKHLNLFEEDLPLPETFYDDYNTRSDGARNQDMRIDDMFLSLDMKLQPDAYDVETGTGGFKNFDAPKQWNAVYNRLTPEQKAAWDAHYDKVNEDFKNANLSGKALSEWKYQRYMKDYLRCVVSVDENVGRLLDYLDEHNLAENTIVIYTSDQGFYLGEHGWYDKRFMYEESLGMPLLMRYPKAIEAGQESDGIALNLDFGPTILDYAGVDVPEEMQGASLRALADGGIPDDWRKSMYYHYYQSGPWHYVSKHYGVRNDRYKLIKYYDEVDAWELYDLQEDPNEVNNLFGKAEYEQVQTELENELNRLREQYEVSDN